MFSNAFLKEMARLVETRGIEYSVSKEGGLALIGRWRERAERGYKAKFTVHGGGPTTRHPSPATRLSSGRN